MIRVHGACPPLLRTMAVPLLEVSCRGQDSARHIGRKDIRHSREKRYVYYRLDSTVIYESSSCFQLFSSQNISKSNMRVNRRHLAAGTHTYNTQRIRNRFSMLVPVASGQLQPMRMLSFTVYKQEARPPQR